MTARPNRNLLRRGTRLRHWVVLALLCWTPSLGWSAEGDPIEPATSISLLSFNVHGIFRLAAKDNPRERMPTIAWLSSRYDVILYQEDFEYDALLEEQLPGLHGEFGNGMGWDFRRVLAKVFVSPVSVLIPYFSPPYGAGISTYARDSLATDTAKRGEYGVCHGWFGANGDCWSNKGWLAVRIRTPEGIDVDVYNTHLEAGPSEESIGVRKQQLEILKEAIEHHSAQNPVIVAGDFNISFGRAGDREVLMDFRRVLELDDSGAGPELANWLERDYILYRPSEEAELVIEDFGEAPEFVSRNRALSDHPALYIRFHARRRTHAHESTLPNPNSSNSSSLDSNPPDSKQGS